MEGVKLPKLKRVQLLDIAIVIVALGMVIYQFIGIQVLLLTSIAFENLHYAFALSLIYLVLVKRRPRLWPLWTVLIAVSIGSTLYVHFFEDDLVLRTGHPEGADLFVGTSLLLVGLVACWFTWGPVIPLVGLSFVGYAFICKYLPYPLFGLSPTFPRLISMLSIGLTGLYGNLLSISANVLFYFMVFAGIFQISGVTSFFAEVGKLVSRISRGGPAQTSVVSSGLFGMISGSAAANVAVDGVFTITWMKDCGYKPAVAAAVEATASTGGQIMPPVMGAAAFVIPMFTGFTYPEIMIRAAIPAVLFYLCLAVQAELIARRDNVGSEAGEKVYWPKLLLLSPLFFVPLGVLIVLLMQYFSVAYSSGAAILGLVVLCMLIKEVRPSPGKLIGGFINGATRGAEIAVTCATLTPIVVLSTYTGLGLKLPLLIEIVSQNILIIALVLTAVVSIILGTGMPTLPVYIIVALVVCPALVKMGIHLLAAHMFAFYFGVFSAITPPVAFAALVASSIANASYFRTGIEAAKLGFLGFLIPFLFVYNPALLGYFEDPLFGVLSIILTVALILLMSAGLTGYLIGRLNLVPRAAALLGALGLGIYICTGNMVTLVVGLILGTMLFLDQGLVRRRGLSIK